MLGRQEQISLLVLLVLEGEEDSDRDNKEEFCAHESTFQIMHLSFKKKEKKKLFSIFTIFYAMVTENRRQYPLSSVVKVQSDHFRFILILAAVYVDN